MLQWGAFEVILPDCIALFLQSPAVQDLVSCLFYPLNAIPLNNQPICKKKVSWKQCLQERKKLDKFALIPFVQEIKQLNKSTCVGHYLKLLPTMA